jgi:hypothetical protein
LLIVIESMGSTVTTVSATDADESVAVFFIHNLHVHFNSVFTTTHYR